MPYLVASTAPGRSSGSHLVICVTSDRSSACAARRASLAPRSRFAVVPDSRTRLADARLYLCTDSRSREGDLEDFLDAVLAGGVDIVQLREKGLEAADEIRFLEVFAAAAERHGALFAANDRADVALAVRAPILHLGQHDLPVPVARRIIGDEPVIGRSTHARDEFDAGQLESGVDYVCAGPTWATPTKPGRPAAGLVLLRHAARLTGPDSRPWFAIGGIETIERLDGRIRAGGRRGRRRPGVNQAEDPGEIART